MPPGSGIVHQVNLECLGRVVFNVDGLVYPDSLVGTDSHTTMINGLGIVGWGKHFLGHLWIQRANKLIPWLRHLRYGEQRNVHRIWCWRQSRVDCALECIHFPKESSVNGTNYLTDCLHNTVVNRFKKKKCSVSVSSTCSGTYVLILDLVHQNLLQLLSYIYQRKYNKINFTVVSIVSTTMHVCNIWHWYKH